jgi:hypothetical protein
MAGGRTMKKLFLLLLFAGGAFAQDCIFSFDLSAAGDSAPFPNGGCIYWTMTYKSVGFTGLSLTLQQAPNALSGGAQVPGTWITFAGTTTLGANPSTSITGAVFAATATTTNLAAWVRVDLSGLTGSGFVTGYAFGYRTNGTAGGSGGGCASPCVVIGPDAPGAASSQDPVQVAGNDGTDVRAIATDTSGRTKVVGGAAVGAAPSGNPVAVAFQDSAGHVLIPQLCTLSVFFDTSGAGNTLLVAASGATKIYLCHLTFQDVGTGNTIQLVQGTGATCAGGTTNFGMAYVAILAGAEDYPLNPLISSASNAVCISLANATRVTGEITYGQH